MPVVEFAGKVSKNLHIMGIDLILRVFDRDMFGEFGLAF